jgi:hypothetical protein
MRFGLVLAAALILSGCRQADGPVPTPTESVQEELVDVRRDLQNVAGGNATAPQELADDLRKYSRRPEALPAVDELSRRLVTALTGTDLGEQDAERLAHDLWLSMAAREISERQVEELQNNVQALLMSIGATEETAQPVAVQIGEVQRAETDRPRRWYEFF